MYQEIIQSFPSSVRENPQAREKLRKAMGEFIEHPSYGKELQLNYFGIGVDTTTEGRPESLHLIERIEFGSDPNEPF